MYVNFVVVLIMCHCMHWGIFYVVAVAVVVYELFSSPFFNFVP